MYTSITESHGDPKETVASCLVQSLTDVFTIYFMAHSYHWNVKGPEFSQFHDMFNDVYEELHDSVDPLAENIRKLGFNAPMTVLDVANFSMIQHTTPSCDPLQMTKSLYGANEVCVAALYLTFEAANAANEQGVADFVAGRIDYHEKLRWMLGTTIGMDKGGMSPRMPGKFRADSLIEATAPVVVVESQPIVVAAASKPAPKKDQIRGSKMNKPGTATAKNAKKIKFSASTETALRNKMQEHNEKAPAGRKTTMSQLKAVYRRGAGAYSSSHRPGKTRDQWAMARVNAYLKLLKSGKPSNPNYTQDNDLLPSGHPRSDKKSASALDAVVAAALAVEILNENEYASPEDAIVALAEYSGLGYEVIPSIRAAWLRGEKTGSGGFNRAKELATNLYNSMDSDLLPARANGAAL